MESQPQTVPELVGPKPPPSVQRRLLELWSLLEPGLLPLFEVTARTWSVFEKGWYIKCFLKPIRRLAQSLVAERELLLLVSNFSEQQPRATEFARRCIDVEGGRLDPIVLIGHTDSEGSNKLKKWGVEQQLSVLPILIAKDADLSDEHLQRTLCSEFFSRDPFDVVSPVTDDAQFYGRRDEALDFARTITFNRIRSCFGIRKIGKTSFISRVTNLIRTERSAIVVFADCSRDAINVMSPGQLLVSLASALQQASLTPDLYATPRSVAAEYELERAGDELLGMIERLQHPIVIAFDELDYITPSSPTRSAHWNASFCAFWRAFRAIYQEAVRQNRRMALIVSGVSSRWFTEESIGGVENAALHFVPEEYLGAFARDASVAMIQRLSRQVGLRFSASDLTVIASTCGDLPFWLRKACSFIHRRVEISRRPLELSSSELRNVLNEFVRTEGQTLAHQAFAHLCRLYPELRGVLQASIDGDVTGQSQRHLLALARYGLVDPRRGHAVAGEMAERGLRSFLAESTASIAVPEASDSVRSAVDQWAEDLAVIGKRRNVIENELRSMLRTLLRQHALQHSDKPTVKQLIEACVPEQRKRALANEAASTIMEKLYWLELHSIIMKYWSVFDRIFVDKSQLSHHMSIVNERPDAHAKTFDPADLALWRRSLSWLEEKVLVA
ncbi:MAG: ATP-binding protein [Phycisphaerales bacterium]